MNAKRRDLDTSQRAMVAAKSVTTTHGGDRRSADFQDAVLHFEMSVEDAATAMLVSTKAVGHGGDRKSDQVLNLALDLNLQEAGEMMLTWWCRG